MREFRPTGFQILPPVVKNIIIINVLVVILQLILGSRGFDLADYFGLHYWKSNYFQPWQFFTHMFMHGSANPAMLQSTLLHIFSNMFALWMFGSILENMWGPKRFLLFYFVCGLGAAICHLAVLHYEFSIVEKAFMAYQANPTLDQFNQFLQQHVGKYVNEPERVNNLMARWSQDPFNMRYSRESAIWINDYLNGYYTTQGYVQGIYDQATVGASGAVFGVLFAFGYLFPNTLIYLYFFVPVKAKYFIAFYALFELYAGIRNSAGDNVAHFAHLGGMLFAFLLLRYWNKRLRNRFY